MPGLNLTTKNFQDEVIDSDQPVLIDFWATWCGPCRMLSPVIDEIAEENPSLKICKVNVDEQPDLASKYGIMSVPTLIVMKSGEIISQSVGAKSKSAILELLNV